MYNLEQSIAEWRRQMLAAGIKSPVPLEELESHLREEIDQRMKSEPNAQLAFNAAVSAMGRAQALQAEFAKTPRTNKSTWAERILAALWFTGCSLSFYSVCHWVSDPAIASPDARSSYIWNVTMNGSIIFIYTAGIIGSVFLFRGVQWGRSIVRMLALLMTIACAGQIINTTTPSGGRLWFSLIAAFSLVTIWLLHLPKDANSTPNAAHQ